MLHNQGLREEESPRQDSKEDFEKEKARLDHLVLKAVILLIVGIAAYYFVGAAATIVVVMLAALSG
jgi:lipid II:glycine glycyltransferase (peptidoglycan interpeptide bridge formation enzyme)